jgi:hypothetical protein
MVRLLNCGILQGLPIKKKKALSFLKAFFSESFVYPSTSLLRRSAQTFELTAAKFAYQFKLLSS